MTLPAFQWPFALFRLLQAELGVPVDFPQHRPPQPLGEETARSCPVRWKMRYMLLETPRHRSPQGVCIRPVSHRSAALALDYDWMRANEDSEPYLSSWSTFFSMMKYWQLA